MKILDLIDTAASESHTGRITGVVIGVVTNNQDPDDLGRVKVKFPWLSDVDESFWARTATPMAGKDRGVFLLPEVDDEVLVAFEHGDVRFPYVLGGLWNGVDTPPFNNQNGKNNVRAIKSRSGHLVKLNDEDGKETVEIIDKSGKVVASRVFEQNQKFDSIEPPAAVAAFNDAFGRIAKDIIAWTVQAL